jgi:hypothetical protein
MWDERNMQSSCYWHHDEVKQRLERLFDLGKIGPSDLKLDSSIALQIATSRDLSQNSSRFEGKSHGGGDDFSKTPQIVGPARPV